MYVLYAAFLFWPSIYIKTRTCTRCNALDLVVKFFKILHPYKHIHVASFLWVIDNSADPDQTPQNAASDQGLHWVQNVLLEFDKNGKKT